MLQVDSSLNLRRNRYTVPQSDMKEKIFEPILRDIIGLVGEQIRLAGGRVTAVLLVGGFGQSEYLKSRIDGCLDLDTQILQPKNGWTAVVRGAAMLGVGRGATSPRVAIASRIARRSYGVELEAPYDSRIHDPLQMSGCHRTA